MQTAEQIAKFTIDLLASKELPKTAASLAAILQDLTKSSFAAVVMWDPDLEEFSDRFTFGASKRSLEAFIQAFAEGFDPLEEDENDLQAIDSDTLATSVPKEIDPAYAFPLKHNDQLIAYLLFSSGKEDVGEIAKQLQRYPFGQALAVAYELRELQRENNRLRQSYEELEDKIALLEDQTHKLIQDLTINDSIRTKQVKRERLVYSISNMVRSSVDIHKVLETTVEQIGTTFGVSRCILLRVREFALQPSVYEYVRETSPVRDLFLTDKGLAFASKAISRRNPHDLVSSEYHLQSDYDVEFLRTLQMRSGLLVPLMMRDQALGVLFLQDCSEARAWNIDDISLIGSLADQISVAIENADLHQEREKQAVTDGLTGISNRRNFNETFEREIERAERYTEPLSLVLLDLDFLKVINDTFGHQVGDEAIKEIARLLAQSSRAVDLPARYGGEEFCLLLPNTDIEMAEQLAERLRRLINDVHIEGPGHISASFGVASYPLHADNADTLLRKADEALYEAKQAGRNMVKVSSGEPQPKLSKSVEN